MRGQRLTYHSWGARSIWVEVVFLLIRIWTINGMCRTEPGQKLKIRYAVDIHAECGGAQRMCRGGRGEGSTKRYGQCSRRQPGYFPECVHEGNSTSLLGITMWNTVTENPPRQLLFSSFLFLLLSFTPLLAPLCFISWKLIFHPHFVFPVFSLSLALSLSALPPHFPRLAQFQFIKHFWHCRNLLFHYCTINHIGRAFSLHQHVDTLPPPNIISLVWQLLSWKMAVTASATQRSAREGGEENWTSSVWTHAVNYADPWTRHRMGAKSVDVFWALVKTGAERMREQLSSWSDFSSFFFRERDFGSVADT